MFQLPPASGRTPIVHCAHFREGSEVLVFKENRRQAFDPGYAAKLELVSKGGGVTWSQIAQQDVRGRVDPDVRAMVVNAYIRGWNRTPQADEFYDVEKSFAVCSYRRFKCRWHELVIEHLDRTFPTLKKLAVLCAYRVNGDDDLVSYNPRDTREGAEQMKLRHTLPKCLQLRTGPEHAGRMLCVRNIKPFDPKDGMSNGSAIRLDREHPWPF